ncbi:MAG: peptidyl-prolyl cis-trans isomerase [Myxococcota bacterium]
MATATDPDRMARRLLAIGAGVGIALAAVGIVGSSTTPAAAPEGAVAVVNGQPVSREMFARLVVAVAEERKSLTLDAETRSRLLERMVDEELLLQRGVELELHRFEPTARRAIVAALIASVTADAEAVEPDRERLRDFFDENTGLFKRPGRISLDAIFVSTEVRSDAQAQRTATEIARRLRDGDLVDEVRAALADLPVARLPGGPLSIETVRQYLGPSVAQVASRLAVGEVSDPIRASPGYFVLRLRDRDPGEIAEFDTILEQVRAEYLRRRGDDGLRDYLAGLREAAEVRILDADRDS